MWYDFVFLFANEFNRLVFVGKSTISKRVSEELNAQHFCTPPICIKGIRADFDHPDYKDVRTAYYALGNYIAALKMNTILQELPVVLDRFVNNNISYLHFSVKYELPVFLCYIVE